MSRQIYLRYPGGKAKALTLSYDDGVRQDIRFIKILDQHGLKCTFNLNSGCYGPEERERTNGRMSEAEATELYTNSGHEVAVHGMMHPHLEALPPAGITYDVMQDRLNLERQFNRTVRGMAYPFGTYNDKVVDCLRACGIVYARTTLNTEKIELPSDWLRMPATCHHNHPRLMNLAKAFLERKVNDTPKLFYMWGHTYEFDDGQNWNIIEDFAALMGGRDDIWYATNIEIYDYVQAYERLIWTADLSTVTNPTTQSILIYVTDTKELIEIAPGETKRI